MSGGPWWHAFGRVRDDIGGAYQLTVVSPSTVPPGELDTGRFAAAWGDYLTSWDHEPSDAEKDAAMPAEYRDEEESCGAE